MVAGLGPQAGDRLLAEVARRLVGQVPPGSLAARLGDDEFAVVPPPGSSPEEVRHLAARLAEALRAPHVVPGTATQSSAMLVSPATLGVSHSGRRRVTAGDLLREADEALIRARGTGARFQVFEGDPLQVRRAAERRVREAIDHDRLRLLYQPIVDFAGGRPAGAEALLRLAEGDRLVPPGLFLDIAERTGLVTELDAWVVEQAIAQLSDWSELWLSINLSARTLAGPEVPRRLIEAVKRGELARDRLRVELKEPGFTGVSRPAESALRNLLANGVQVGLEGYGTSRSATDVIEHFPIHFVKIDQSATGGEGATLQSMIDSAHSHKIQVIAEGIESPRQARRLREYGCDFAQGFHFGRPGEPSRIVRG